MEAAIECALPLLLKSQLLFLVIFAAPGGGGEGLLLRWLGLAKPSLCLVPLLEG